MFNVIIHLSADYYKYYITAFLMKNLKNVQLYNETNIPMNIYVHCIFIYKPKLNEIKKYLRPFTKVVCFSGEPHEIYSQFVHLIIDTKREQSLCTRDTPFVYLPFYVQSFAERFTHPREILLPLGFKREDAEAIMKRKTKFCAYMYSNPVEFRDRFFHVMKETYKSPDTLGSCCSTKHVSETTRMLYDQSIKTFYEDAIEKYQPYKFVIAFENSKINGYITEKLMNPTLARAIPIYLGAPDLFSDGVFNPKAIIHVNDFPSYEACVAHIKKVDECPELYLNYLMEPLFVGNKLPKYFNSNYLLPAFLQIFHQDVESKVQ